ncbi:MAG: FAD-binding oxidoreductase [Nocardioidaceae bacterium]
MGCALSVRYGELSFWHSHPALDWTPRPALSGDLSVDVAIVGGGFTGLWTAYYLAEADPSLRIAVLERDVAGFGASDATAAGARRCSRRRPPSSRGCPERTGPARSPSTGRCATRSTRSEGSWPPRPSTPTSPRAARSCWLAPTRGWHGPAPRSRRRARGTAARTTSGCSTPTRPRPSWAPRASSARPTPHCAAIHPAKTVRGLAEVVERRGVRVLEQTRVLALEPGRVRTEHGTVTADVVVRATEGYTASLQGLGRAVVPVYSLMVATEPLPEEVWERIGLRRRETFSDFRHLLVYGQRTADDRLAFGGRGAPYHFGSDTSPANDRNQRVFVSLHQTLLELFPVLRGTRFTHAWGGALGVPRDWCASVGLDPTTRVAWAGGYVGDGVGTTNLSGRTLRDLILGQDTELTRLPWVNHRSPAWEPEPLRWLGINAGLRAMTFADTEERLTHRQSLTARVLAPLLGH